MPSETHLVPLDRRHLCSRLLYINTIHHCQDTYSAEISEEIRELNNTQLPNFELLQDAFLHFASREALEDERDERKESFLQRLNIHFRNESERFLNDSPTLLKALRDRFQKEISMVSCSNCTSELQNRYQPDLLGNKGCYLNQLRFFFEIASEVALNYYATFTTLKDVKFPRVIFNTQKYLSKDSLHSLPIPYSIGGTTTFCSLADNCWSAVTLGLEIEGFDTATYFALPYLFFHECFAHTYHGIYPNSLKREDSEPYDSFTEGWMDFIAFKIFEMVIEGKSLIPHPTANFSNENHNHGYKYHFARYDTSSNNHSINAPLIKQGQTAANKLRRTLENLPSSRGKAWEILFQISFDLNMMRDFTKNKRMQFVTIIDNLVQPGATETPRHLEITRVIQNYLVHQKTNILVDEILSLKTRFY